MSIVNQTEAPDVLEKRPDDADSSGIIMDKWLANGITISSASVDSFDGDDELLITNVSVNGSTYTRPEPNDTETYAAGLVITYDYAGGIAGTTYDVPFLFTKSNGKTGSIIVRWKVQA